MAARLSPGSLRELSLNKPVVVTLCGGLGNQLFQYAVARAISARSNSPLVLDLTWFDDVLLQSNMTVRKYALAPFELPVLLRSSIATQSKFSQVLSNFRALISRRLGIHIGERRYIESSFRFDKEVLTLRAPVLLSGYWQSYRYFDDVANLIRKEIKTIRTLSKNSAEILKKIRASDAICVHVRRGDYVTNKGASLFHGLCSLEYYLKGVASVAQGLKYPHGFVFSDDPDWVKDNLDIGIDFTVVDVNGPDDAHQDIWLMSSCKHFVIANSSLSWWGAWLGDELDKRVVYPSRWFTDRFINTSDLFPDGWISL